MARLRRLGYPLLLTGARLRARGGQAALAAGGIAAAAAALAVLATASLVAQDRSVQRRVAGIPAPQRSIVTTWAGTSVRPSDRWRRLDGSVREAFTGVDPSPLGRVLIFPEMFSRGSAFNLGALDGLARWVRITGGREPRRCSPAVCEVVRIAGDPVAPGLQGVRVVGRATLVPGSPLAPFLSRRGGALLLADGVDGLSRLHDLEGVFRTYGWVLPLEPRAVHPWSVRSLLANTARAGSTLQSRSALFSVTVPTTELTAARTSAHVAGRRLLLLGGGLVALLLAFAALTAARARRASGAAVRRLTWFGARRWQVGVVTAAEAGAVAVVGTALGWALGAAGGAAVAGAAGAPVGAVLARTVLSATGGWLALGLAAVATIVLCLVVREPGRAVRGIRPLDVAALAALGVVAVAVARGDADPADVGGGTGVLLLLLPGLLTFAIAVLVARVFPPALRACERMTRRSSPPVRLAIVSLARDRGVASVSVVFVAVAVAVALFTAAYRATLSANVRERAAYALPADYVLRETTGQTIPFAPAQRLGHAVPVIRGSGGTVSLAGRRPFTLLGLPAGEIEGIRGWRSDFSPESRTELAARLRPARPPSLRGLRLPTGGRRLELPIALRGDPIALSASIRSPNGVFAALDLGEARPGDDVLRADIPAAARGGLLVALRVTQPALEAFSAGHHDTGSEGAESVSNGTLEFGRPRAGGRVLPPIAGWAGTGGVRTDGGPFRYLVSRAQVSLIRPQQPLDGTLLPVLASPALAAASDNDRLALSVDDNVVPVRLVGTIRRFPSTTGDVVVADERTLEVVLDTVQPGLGRPSEAWLSGPASVASALRQPAFAGIEVRSHRALERQLRDDPLARGALAVLWATALVALALAVAGIALGAIATARDARPELFDLEGQGLGPAALRRRLDAQAGLAAAAGAVGGIIAGLALAALVVGVVAVTANATTPVPPLRLRIPWLEAAAIVATSLVVGLACAAVASRRALAGPVAARPEEAL
jgi:hypothetical protein